MIEQEYVKELLSDLAKAVKEELQKKPFFLVTEDDLKGFIYSRLFMRKEIQEPFYDRLKRPNFKLHTQYPRYRKENGQIKKPTHTTYDVVILRQTRLGDDPFFGSESFSERAVWIGFELKLYYNAEIKNVCGYFELEKGAFLREDQDDPRIQKLPCDLGIIFHVNAAKEELTSKSGQDNIEKGMETIQKEVEIPLFVVYLESDCKNSEPIVLFKPPQG